MKKLFSIMLATASPLANDAQAGDPPHRPEFRLSRQDEDRSALCDPELRSNLFENLTWTANYSHFFAGVFLHENPPGEDVNYFSTWITSASNKQQAWERDRLVRGAFKSSGGSGFPNLQTYRFILHRFCPGHR